MAVVKSIFPGWSLCSVGEKGEEMLLVAGGRAPSSEWLKSCAVGRRLWGIDRGARSLLESELEPSGVTGDFDSLDSEMLKSLEKKGVKLYSHPQDKDFTDLELALIEAMQEFPEVEALWLTGGFGGRLDHLMGNLRVLELVKRQGKRVGLMDEKEVVILVGPNETTQASFEVLPRTVSLIPLSGKITGANLEGCHWRLPKTEWQALEMPPISNRLAAGSREVACTIEEGVAALYFCWEELGL